MVEQYCLITGRKEDLSKNKRKQIIFALPCKNQDEKWNGKQRKLYQELLLEADAVIYISEECNDFCMKKVTITWWNIQPIAFVLYCKKKAEQVKLSVMQKIKRLAIFPPVKVEKMLIYTV